MIEDMPRWYARARINAEPQKVITQDNVSVTVDCDLPPHQRSVKATSRCRTRLRATMLAQTNLRNLIGDKSLDETLTARDRSTPPRAVLDEATNTWGVR